MRDCKKYSDVLFDYLTEGASDLCVDVETLENGVKKDRYEIVSDEESERFGKPKGKYELMSIPDVLYMQEEDIEYCAYEFAKTVEQLIGKLTRKDRVLVVGLGNRHISSDSLGAKVVGKVNITIESSKLPKVMAICPSVMGLTGIETVDIIEGVSKNINATHVIIIDSLCASSIERLGKSIQATNTGLCPGGGIGNNRKCIDNSIAPNVYSIGVPLLIYASTFVSDTMESHDIFMDTILSIMHKYKKCSENKDILQICESIKKVITDEVDNLIVSIKDIEECVEVLSYIVARGLNIALGVDG